VTVVVCVGVMAKCRYGNAIIEYVVPFTTYVPLIGLFVTLMVVPVVGDGKLNKYLCSPEV
jgi:hypothetical protein